MNTATETTEIDPLENLIKEELEMYARRRATREKQELEEVERAKADVARAEDPTVQKIIAELLTDAQKTLEKAFKSQTFLRLLQGPYPTTLCKTGEGFPVLNLTSVNTVMPHNDCRPVIILIGFLLATNAEVPKLSLFCLFPEGPEARDRTTSLPVIPEELEWLLRELANTETMVKSVIYTLSN